MLFWLPLVAAVIRMVSMRPAEGRPTLTPTWVKVVFAIYLCLFLVGGLRT